MSTASTDRRPHRAGRKALWQTVLALCLTAMTFGAAGLAQGDPGTGKVRYAVCQTCHGAAGEGNRAFNAPGLAGLDRWYLERQIRFFRDGARGYDARDAFGMQMKGMVMTLPDEAAVQDVLAFIATLEERRPDPTLQGDAKIGGELFEVCAQCHGAGGAGRQAMNAPRIAGLEDWYVLRQLQNFRQRIRGEHKNDPYGVQMRPMIRAVLRDPQDEKPLRDLTAYLSTLP